MNALMVTEGDLHAYLDGELPEDRRSLVEAHLRDHPEDAERLQAYQADGDAIARTFSRAGQLRTMAYEASSIRRRPVAGQGWRRIVAPAWPRAAAMPWQRAAVIALIIAGTLIAGIVGPFRSSNDDALWTRFGAQALTAHLSLSPPQSDPVIAASFEDISDYLSAALKARIEVRYPESSGYKLTGSRFIATAKGRVVQLAFQDTNGKLVTMYIEPWPGKPDAPFREVTSQAGVTTMVWVDDGIGCAVSGALPSDELERAARSLYKAMLS